MAKKYEIPPKLKSAAKRLTPLLVVFVLIVGMLPVSALAADSYTTKVYIDGELVFNKTGSSFSPRIYFCASQAAGTIVLTYSLSSDHSNSAETSITALHPSWTFLGFSYTEGATSPESYLLADEWSSVGGTFSDKTVYLYTVWEDPSAEYTSTVYLNGELFYSASAKGQSPSLSFGVSTTSQFAVTNNDTSDFKGVDLSGNGTILGMASTSGATVAEYAPGKTVTIGGTASNVTYYAYTVYETPTYSTYFSVNDEPYYASDPASGTCPAVTLKVVSDGFQLLDTSGNVLKTYTYTGSDIFTGVQLSEDNGYKDVEEKLYCPGETVTCGGVDHTCSFDLTIVTEAAPEYTLRIYVDGTLKYTGSAENNCPTISIIPRSTGHLDISDGTSAGADVWAVSFPGSDYEFLGMSLTSGASAADFLLDQKAQFGGSASDATVYLYSVWTKKADPVYTIPAGTWLANKTLSACPSRLAATSIPFAFTTASDSLASSVASWHWNSDGTQLFFDDQSVYYYSSPFGNVGWNFEPYRLITTSAAQEVPADFYAWFSSNFTVASASDTIVSQISGSLYHRTERVQIYGTSLVGSYTMTFSFDGEKTIVSAFQDDLVVWTETLSVDDEYEYITLLLNTGNGVSTITLNSGDTHTIDVLTSDCTFTVRYGEYVNYSDYSGFGSFIVDVLGGFLGFSILPGLTFGGLLAVFVVLGIVKLFFSK